MLGKKSVVFRAKKRLTDAQTIYVNLNEQEHLQVEERLKKGKHKARTMTRACILLSADEGKTDQAITRISLLQRGNRDYATGSCLYCGKNRSQMG